MTSSTQQANSDGPANELKSEQRYFDEALEYREKSRHTLDRSHEAGIHKGAVEGLRSSADGFLKAFRLPEEAVAFGKMAFDDDEVLYIGYQPIWGESAEILVMNWQRPAAAPFFEATVDDRMGLALKREFQCDGNEILAWEDLVYQDLLARVEELESRRTEPSLAADSLLSSLADGRTGEMQDIVRTIQSAQHKLLRSPLDQLLVIQGGPGTGKTAVALHRVSWLLYNHREEMSAGDVLVVGPSPIFVRYIRRVLPSLGDESVNQTSIQALAPQVAGGRTEAPETARLKGELRMRNLVEVALGERIRIPSEPQTVGTGGQATSIDSGLIASLASPLRNRPYMEGREAFRRSIEGLIQERRIDLNDGAQEMARLVDRVWPSLTAPLFLRDLFGSRDRLTVAAGDSFTAGDVTRLYRPAAERVSEETWSEADLPLLDYAHFLISGERNEFRHIVVDEAQDLSPMQLEMLRRRSSTGSMTVLGDVAQSSGLWARDSWDTVVEVLQQELPVSHETLRFGYRVPRQLFDFASQILPHIAPM